MTNSADKAAPQAPRTDESSQKKRRPPGGLECKLGLLLGLAGLIGSRLGHLWIAFDVFSQFTLQFGVVALGFLIGALMRRAKLFTAFVVILAGVIGIGVWPHVISRSPMSLGEAASGEKIITIASFNTWYENEQAGAVEAEVNRIDADIIVLVEVGNNKKPALDRLKSRYPHQAKCFNIDFCNLVILSKFPIAESSAQVKWEGAPYLMAKLGPELGGLSVIAVHTIRFPHSRAQFRQTTALSALIEKTPGRKLVMGDFNATPFSRIIQAIQTRTGLIRLSGLPSWPSHLELPQIAIDHIFVSPGIHAVETLRIGEAAGSDHYPIISTIAVPLTP